MAKQPEDRTTDDMLGRRSGRPRKQPPLSAAERARRFREQRKLFPKTADDNGMPICEVCASARDATCGICCQ